MREHALADVLALDNRERRQPAEIGPGQHPHRARLAIADVWEDGLLTGEWTLVQVGGLQKL
jgi:hypothetical protein